MTCEELCRLRRFLRDVGRFDWTLQVAHPPPLSESGERRRAQEKAIRLTVEFRQKNIAEAKQRSTPILGLDLNSGLGLKGVNEQVEEPHVENSTGASRKWQDMRWKTCSEIRTALRLQRCF